MSVDGFSMSSMGLPKDITSAQAAMSAEHLAMTGNEKIVGKIDRALNKKIDNNTDEEKEKNQFFNDGFEEDDDDEKENEENENPQNGEEIFDDGMPRKRRKHYKAPVIADPENITIRINQNLNNVELYNIATQKTVETISTDDFIGMVNKLDYNSGILVNKDI